MDNKYSPEEIEAKWQKYWEKHKTFEVSEDRKKKKFYGLVEFPYPSGAGLHVGHPRSYTAMDVIARKRRMQGYNVLYPIGFDSFGLPTENFAIKTGRPPAQITDENIATFTRQLKTLGFSFDWSRAVTTSDPEYYKWTQWIFLQFFKHGLAYKKKQPINWCPKDKIGLANEEVVDGCCERCGGPVEKRDKEQWMLAITKYADKLLEGLKEVDYIERAKLQQENWIGRSEGAEIEFRIQNSEFRISVFTTRPDTLFGVTYMVVAPEHEIITKIKTKIENWDEVEQYTNAAKRKTDLERTELQKEKTGVELKGIKAVNPGSGEEIPVWVADYVLASYGTGAIMAVPAHDERDFEFAKKYNFIIKYVVSGGSLEEEAFTEAGNAVNSDFLNGLSTSDAKEKMIEWLEEKGIGQRKVQYKLRDWVFSRQRYWGEPIPLVYCETCADWIPLPEKELPLKLPDIQNYQPTDTGESPLAAMTEWVNTTCPKCKGPARRETDTMPNWAGSSWYFLRYCDPNNKKDFFNDQEFHFRSEIEATESDKRYFGEFKKIYSDLKRENIPVWTGNRFLLNGLNRALWIPFRTVCFLAFETHVPVIRQYLENAGYKQTADHAGNVLFEKEGVRMEIVPVYRDGEDVYSLTYRNARQKMTMADFPDVEFGNLWGFNYRTVSPEYNLAHYEYIQKHESSDREGLGDADKIAFLREWIESKNAKVLYWNQIDWYNGGMEHTVLHLLYSRFWNQFLYDIGVVPTREPYKKRTSHGMILASDGQKMSKSLGNVINPDDMVAEYGADALRTYILFMGPFDQAIAWDTNGLVGVRRFLERVWFLQSKIYENIKTFQPKADPPRAEKHENNKEIETLLHQTIKKVTEDIEGMRFNTAIAKLMELCNELTKQESISSISYHLFIKLLSPFAPHVCEELWNRTGGNGSIAFEPWPEPDPSKTVSLTITIAIQINGKLRDTIELSADVSEADATSAALASDKVRKYLEGKQPKKVIYVKGKLVSIVVE